MADEIHQLKGRIAILEEVVNDLLLYQRDRLTTYSQDWTMFNSIWENARQMANNLEKSDGKV